MRILISDPSEYRPEYSLTNAAVPECPDFAGKPVDQFRNYGTDNVLADRVKGTYLEMHTNQTFDFVKDRIAHWCSFDKTKLNIMDALDLLNTLVDESDPDVDMPNIVHAFQTAERIRQVWPQHDWFHVIGLIHDLGKVMAIWGEPQWAVVGDTFPVGCQFAPSIVFRDDTFQHNEDLNDPVHSTKNGIYHEGTGLANVIMSWGHDEYFYRCLKHNKTTLPEEGLNMIRFHSFYPWHTGGDYMHLCEEKDLKMLPWVREFNKFDLYSKSDVMPDIEALKPYYQSLIDKYTPGLLEF